MAWNTLIDSALLVSSADPNDPAATDVWININDARAIRIGQAWRGRQYELDQNLTGQMRADLLNIDEALNPGNSASSLLANIKPMRRLRWMVMYPRGGTGNLLNPTNPLPQIVDSFVQDGSFESYTAAASVPWIIGIGTSPVVTTTNPQQGTKCLTWTTSGTGQQMAGFWVATIPGRQYTASVFFRQTIADTASLFVNGGASSGTTTTTAAYVRLTVTFTATKTRHDLYFGHFVCTNGNVINADAIQVEPGGTANAFTTSGPRIRGIWGGHVERWPSSWVPGTAGYQGLSQITAVGPFAALARIPMHTDLVTAILKSGPQHYWPLWDGSSSTLFGDITTNGGPNLARWAAKDGAGTDIQVGAQLGIVGDPGGSGITFTQSPSGAVVGTFIGAGPAFRTAGVTFPNNFNAANFGVTIMAAVKLTYPFTGGGSEFILKLANFIPNNGNQIGIGSLIANGDGSWDCTVIGNGQGFTSLVAGATHVLDDGKTHILQVSITQTNPGNIVLNAYIDSQFYASTTSPSGANNVVQNAVNNIEVGGRYDGVSTTQILNGAVSHVAIWNRALSPSEMSQIVDAAKGHLGEFSTDRAFRYMQSYTGDFTFNVGRSTMGPPTATEGTFLGAALQRLIDTEGGNLYESRDAEIIFEVRDDRYFRTTATAVLGERTDLGEYPYEENFAYDYDPTQVYNQSAVTQSGGVRAIAGPDSSSSKSYYIRGLPLTVDCQSALEAQDHADWIVANRKQPKQRVQMVTLNLGANPSLIPLVLDLELGKRYTVTRRPKAANAGAGITISGDYFLEKITHRQVDPELGTWWVDLQLSPVPLQPWILGDATYGVLDSTTILGF